MTDMLKIHENDNVAVKISGEAAGHKFALCDIKKGENVIKYGLPIGHAVREIKKGEHVHTHNVKTNLNGVTEYTYVPKIRKEEKREKAYFSGYLREDKNVGIRNEIWIINTVGCVNKTAQIIAERSNEKLGEKRVFTFAHPFGCSQLGDDHKNTQKVLAGLVRNPNAGGVLVLGLGCENNNINEFKKTLGIYEKNRLRFLSVQETADEIEEGVKLIFELVKYADTFERTRCLLDKLVIGLKCGGSDGFSGITANPLVGRFSDMAVHCGASAVLTEVPEMFGAEILLMERCINRGVFDKTAELINGFKKYFENHGQPVYENPSPGNKEGGITTLEDKSLGCVQKGGSADVAGVIDIETGVETAGLNLLSGPGNDLVAITNLAAAGCQVILFTTGRGTPVGGPVPTVKISSNTPLARLKPHWIDFDAGAVLNGENLDKKLFDYVLEVCGGRKTNNEKHGFKEISIFKDGVTL